ncbi:hypothetical protein ACFWH4_34050 [Streptomyces sp. NPDC127091]
MLASVLSLVRVVGALPRFRTTAQLSPAGPAAPGPTR